MKRTFLKKDFFIQLTLVSIFFLLILPGGYFFLWACIISFLMFLFRQNKISYKNSPSNAADIVLSPVTGRVTEIIKNEQGQFIKINISFWGPYGFFLPFSSEVTNARKIEGDKKWRGNKYENLKDNAERFFVEFQNKLGHKTVIEIFSCLLSGRVDIWLRAGDKGRSAACFGLLPFGGAIVIKIPENSDVVVSENEKVKAGSSILAGMKG